MNPKQSEKGQGLVEFAYILVLVVIVIVVVLGAVGPSVGNVFNTLVTVFTG